MQLTEEQKSVIANILKDVKSKSIVTMGGFAGVGKASANSALVCTPFGYKLMSEIRIKDQISNPDGSVARVIGVYPQGKKQIYKVTFIDGRFTRVTEDHLWLFHMSSKKYKSNRKYIGNEEKIHFEVNTTKFLVNYIDEEKKKKRPCLPLIPLSEPIKFNIIGNKNRLIIDPYLLGLLLGDGGLSQASMIFTSKDRELVEAFRNHGYQLNLKKNSEIDYRFKGKKSLELKNNIKKLGLFGTKSDTKFIPKDYLHSSIEDRLSLIQGLMDTDGSLCKHGSCEFSSVSKELAESLQWIIRSLGGKATIKTRIGKYRSKKDNQLIFCKKVYRVYIQHPEKEKLFNLNRKKIFSKAFNGGNLLLKNRMISIEPDGFEEATCIQVDHPNNLYITDDFIVTHNTTVIQHLHHLLKDWSICAYTGKAANVLRRKNLDASTIHSLIYEPEKNADGSIKIKNGGPVFILADSLPCNGIIVDEASMVSKEIYADLLSFNLPILFVGDHGQLEPVGSDFNIMKNPDYCLEKIHRNAGEIAHFAEHIRKGYRAASFNSDKQVKFVTASEAKAMYSKVDQVIAAYNKSRVEINVGARVQLWGELYQPQPIVGDKVMCLRNHKQCGLFNGMQGVVKYIYKKPSNKFIFTSDGVDYDILFDPTQFNKDKYDFSGDRMDPHPFDYCNGITCHKAQGDEWDTGLVIEQLCKGWDHKRWAYTAASRFKKLLNWQGV